MEKHDSKEKQRAINNVWGTNEILKILIEKSPLAFIVVDSEGIVHLWNKGAEKLFGWKESEVFRKNYPIIPTENEGEFQLSLNKISQNKEVRFEETVRKGKDGKLIDVSVYGAPIKIDDPSFEGAIIIINDITNRVLSEKELTATLKEIRDIKYALDESSIVGITDASGIITYVNKKFCEISKYSVEELIGSNHNIVKSGHHPKSFFKDLWRTIGNGEVWHGEVKNKAKDGSYYWVDTTIVPFLNDQGKPYQYVSIRNDITQRKQAEEEMNYLLTHDELTGLANFRTINRLLKSVSKKQMPVETVHLFLIDIDRFKMINDAYGHSLGNQLLINIAERLQDCLTEDDKIGRLSGDEFILIFKDRSQEEVEEIAKRIIHSFETPFLLSKQLIYTSCSIGISRFPEDSECGETLLKQADMALHLVKDHGRNNYQFYHEHGQRKNMNRKMNIETQLRTAIDNNEFYLVYQPKWDLTTNTVSGMEALLRWNNPVLGTVSPGEFIPISEETGLISTIGKWVIKEACEQYKRWQLEKLPVPNRVAVNLSVRQFQEKELVHNINNILHEVGIDPKYLELEITENISMNDSFTVKEKLKALKNLGIYLSIDDFGTGYSSLNYLRDYPVDALKIDKSFIDEIIDQDNPSVLKGIIALAQALKLHIVAEGVEEEKQVEYLKGQGCDEIQGYFFSKPLPAEELVQFMEQKNTH